MLVMSVELKTGDIIFNIERIDILPQSKFKLLFEDDEEESRIININDVESITML